MAQGKEIEVLINADGTIEIDMIGFHGQGCANLAEQIAKVLGKAVKIDKKCEYFEAEHTIQQKQHVRL